MYSWIRICLLVLMTAIGSIQWHKFHSIELLSLQNKAILPSLQKKKNMVRCQNYLPRLQTNLIHEQDLDSLYQKLLLKHIRENMG